MTEKAARARWEIDFARLPKGQRDANDQDGNPSGKEICLQLWKAYTSTAQHNAFELIRAKVGGCIVCRLLTVEASSSLSSTSFLNCCLQTSDPVRVQSSANGRTSKVWVLWVPGVVEEQSDINYTNNSVEHENVLEAKAPTQRTVQQFKEKRDLMWEDESSFFASFSGVSGKPVPGSFDTSQAKRSTANALGNKKGKQQALAGGLGSGGASDVRSIALEAAKLKSAPKSVKDCIH